MQLKSNAELFNLMVPFKVIKQMPFNKYLHIDCKEDLSFLKMSQLLTKEHLLTFHSKCKGAPEYPFGQVEQNSKKFKAWASKIYQKFKESQTEFKIVLIL
jgi:hypothetical protein